MGPFSIFLIIFMFIIAQINESIYSHREVVNKTVGDAGLYMRNKIISNQNRSRKLVFFRAITKNQSQQ